MYVCIQTSHIYKYTIGEDDNEYERVGEFPEGYEIPTKHYFFLRAFTLVHPSWPTPIPTLPPNI